MLSSRSIYHRVLSCSSSSSYLLGARGKSTLFNSFMLQSHNTNPVAMDNTMSWSEHFTSIIYEILIGHMPPHVHALVTTSEVGKEEKKKRGI